MDNSTYEDILGVEEILKTYRSVLRSLAANLLRATALFPLAAGAAITKGMERLLHVADRIEGKAPERAVAPEREKVVRGLEGDIVLPSQILYECYTLLLFNGERGKEDIAIIGGWEKDGTVIAGTVHQPYCSVSTSTRAEVDYDSLAGHMKLLRFCGYKIVAVAHIHPWDSEDVHPSARDIATQRRWERLFGNVIGIVFTNSGVFRIFTADAKPDVRIIGKDVEKVGDNLYRLSNTEEVRRWVRRKR
ncbi:hypothetical protein [Archaeoglobus sp.]